MSTVGEVRSATVTDVLAGGVHDVTSATITGTGVAAEAYASIPGPPGPPGPTGILRVNHGSDPNVVRPSSPIVLWVGSVEPLNADQSTDLIVRVT